MNERLVALDFVCDCLAVDASDQRTEALRATMKLGRAPWGAVLEIANDQLVSPALWAALHARGLTSELPGEVSDYLRELHDLNGARNQQLQDQALEAVRILNAIGVVPILLKGTAALFSELYDDIAARVMLDLDILVPRDEAQTCWERLCAHGYRPIDCGRDFSAHHHLEPLQRPGTYATIEVHRDALPEAPSRILPTERIWARSRLVEYKGVRMRLPDPSAQAALSLLHSAVAHGGYEAASGHLRSLHELALIARRYANRRLDWNELRGDFSRNRKGRVFHGWIYLSKRMFGAAVPMRIGDGVSTIAYHARYRLQAQWRWLDELARRLCLFSARSICERYACDDRFGAVSAGRLRLIWEVSGDYTGRIMQSGWRRVARCDS